MNAMVHSTAMVGLLKRHFRACVYGSCYKCYLYWDRCSVELGHYGIIGLKFHAVCRSSLMQPVLLPACSYLFMLGQGGTSRGRPSLLYLSVSAISQRALTDTQSATVQRADKSLSALSYVTSPSNESCSRRRMAGMMVWCCGASKGYTCGVRAARGVWEALCLLLLRKSDIPRIRYTLLEYTLVRYTLLESWKV